MQDFRYTAFVIIIFTSVCFTATTGSSHSKKQVSNGRTNKHHHGDHVGEPNGKHDKDASATQSKHHSGISDHHTREPKSHHQSAGELKPHHHKSHGGSRHHSQHAARTRDHHRHTPKGDNTNHHRTTPEDAKDYHDISKGKPKHHPQISEEHDKLFPQWLVGKHHLPSHTSAEENKHDHSHHKERPPKLHAKASEGTKHIIHSSEGVTNHHPSTHVGGHTSQTNNVSDGHKQRNSKKHETKDKHSPLTATSTPEPKAVIGLNHTGSHASDDHDDHHSKTHIDEDQSHTKSPDVGSKYESDIHPNIIYPHFPVQWEHIDPVEQNPLGATLQSNNFVHGPENIPNMPHSPENISDKHHGNNDTAR